MRRFSRFASAPIALAALAVCAVAWFVPRARAQSRPNEYDVKAAYLYNFGRFVVDWPENVTDKSGQFPICVLGQDPFGASLDNIVVGQSVNGQKVVARRITKSADAFGCRVLFISSSEEAQLKNILPALDKGVLTVSDINQFSQRGGMIQFVTDGERVRFEVNLTNTGQGGLTLSSELLKVAVAVKRTVGN